MVPRHRSPRLLASPRSLSAPSTPPSPVTLHRSHISLPISPASYPYSLDTIQPARLHPNALRHGEDESIRTPIGRRGKEQEKDTKRREREEKRRGDKERQLKKGVAGRERGATNKSLGKANLLEDKQIPSVGVFDEAQLVKKHDEDIILQDFDGVMELTMRVDGIANPSNAVSA
ncbi:hypothetical protein Tco_1508789 [Tanacetum coccineum]